MVKGIGPVYAKKLVEKFGETIFDIIEQESGRLEDVDGIEPKRRQKIKEAWAEQKVIRKIMVFLHSNGVSTRRAVRIRPMARVPLIKCKPILTSWPGISTASDSRPPIKSDKGRHPR